MKLTFIYMACLVLLLGSISSGQYWQQTGGPQTANIRALAVTSDDVIFAGTGFNIGGIFKSTNGGHTWVQTSVPNTSINCIAVDNADNIFAGTWKIIYRSQDDGANWLPLGATNGLPATNVKALAFADGGEAYAGTTDGVYLSTDDGDNWIQRSNGLSSMTVNAVVVGSGGTVYAGTNNGVNKSTDYGQNWTNVSEEQIDNFVYAMAIAADGDIYAGTWFGGVYRSPDDGITWTPVNTGLSAYPAVWALAIHANSDIYLGTGLYGDGKVYRSTDDGATWTDVGSPDVPISDNRSLAIDPYGSVFVGNTHGIYRSTDEGAIWTRQNGGLIASTVTAMVEASGGRIVAGEDGGGFFISDNDGAVWLESNSGTENLHIIHGIYRDLAGDVYACGWASYQANDEVFRSTDDGSSWAMISPGQTPRALLVVAVNSSGTVFGGSNSDGMYKFNGSTWDQINSGLNGDELVEGIDFNSGEDLFIATRSGVFKSTNDGGNWTDLSSPITEAYAILVGANDYIYVGGYEGVYRSTNGGGSWGQISSDYIIEMAENSEGAVFISSYAYDYVTGIATPKVFVTENYGDTWTEISDGFPEGAISSLLAASDGDIYAGVGGRGVYRLAYGSGEIPHVIAVSPEVEDIGMSQTPDISATFDSDMNATTINSGSFLVYGENTGLHVGSIVFDAPTRTATFTPDDPFKEGERVRAELTTAVSSAAGYPLEDCYTWEFVIDVYGGSGTFESYTSYLSGLGSSYFLAAGDLDGDGDVDIVVPGFYDEAVAVFLNDGEGTFTLDGTHTVGLYPDFVTTADVDNNGTLDLLTSNFNDGSFSVLSNLGGATFATHVDYPASGYPSSVAVADFDCDGYVDVAVNHMGADKVSIFVNDGAGIFTYSGEFPVGTAPRQVITADLDQDGRYDLVTINEDDNSISVLMGNGDATFDPQVTYPVGATPMRGFAGDLDGDGAPDLAISNNADNSLSVLFNTGGGIFSAAIDLPVAEDPRNVWMADIDGDDDLDLVAGCAIAPSGVAVLENEGAGLFAPYQLYRGAALAVIAANLDSDGDMDLVLASSDRIGVLLNGGRCGDLAFRPDPDGWQFSNSGSNMWPESWWTQFDYTAPEYPPDLFTDCNSSDFPDWPLFVDVFGEDQCYLGSPPDPARPDPLAVEYWKVWKGSWGGSCFGFAVSACLFFNEFLDFGSVFPGYEKPFEHYPVTDETRGLVNKYMWYQVGENHWQAIWDALDFSTPNQTLQDIKDMFCASIRDDRVLVIINNNGGGGHAINPWKWEPDAADPNLEYVYVYDNNYPGQEDRYVTFNIAANTWDYNGLPTWGGSGYICLIEPISAYTTTPVLPWRSDKSALPAEGDMTGEAGNMSIYFTPGDAVHLESSLGTIGYDGNDMYSTVAGAVPIIPITGTEVSPIGYYLPVGEWTCDLAGVSGGSARVSFMPEGAGRTAAPQMLIYRRTGVEASEHEYIRFDPADAPDESDGVVVSNPGQIARDFDIGVIHPMADSEIVIRVTGFDSSPDDSTEFSGNSDGQFLIRHYGMPVEYDLQVRIVGGIEDTSFYCHSVPISTNSSQLIVPDWRPFNDSIPILVDDDMDGQFEDTLMLPNEGPVIYTCGDADANEAVNIGDAVYLINYIFKSGPAPDPECVGDASGDDTVNIGDAVYLINYIFKSGPAPVDDCCR